MSDWQVGDLAMCLATQGWVKLGTLKPSVNAPENGKVYRVSGIEVDCGFHCLVFDEWPNDRWESRLFRKIRPDEHEACEPEFVTLLKKRKVDA